MIRFNIPQMSCGHCVKAVTEAVREADPQAKVEVDLASKNVAVESTADRGRIAQALAEAGYAPQS